uniref:Enhancer of rudimentary 1 n=1 Tax=Apopellia endiviifolia (species B) TaxID=119729 RepID=A0A6B7NW07_9MARC|nr:enhancer of rudimentary 1 [Apopellia endiviifolia (species B)]
MEINALQLVITIWNTSCDRYRPLVPFHTPRIRPCVLAPSFIMAQNRHTIVLMQPISNRATRTFMDFDTVSSAMDGICGIYEKKLKDMNPQLRNITYDIADLYKFIDSLIDMSALVFDPSMNAYVPYDRQWIKQRAFQHLKKLAGQYS